MAALLRSTEDIAPDLLFSGRKNTPTIAINLAESNNKAALGLSDTSHPTCIMPFKTGGRVRTEQGWRN